MGRFARMGKVTEHQVSINLIHFRVPASESDALPRVADLLFTLMPAACQVILAMRHFISIYHVTVYDQVKIELILRIFSSQWVSNVPCGKRGNKARKFTLPSVVLGFEHQMTRLELLLGIGIRWRDGVFSKYSPRDLLCPFHSWTQFPVVESWWHFSGGSPLRFSLPLNLFLRLRFRSIFVQDGIFTRAWLPTSLVGD